MLSGPVAFLGLMFLSSLRMPSSLMSIMSISGNGVPDGVGMLVPVSLVNTDMYCLFRMFALFLAELNSCPLSLSGGIPELSFLSDLM